MARRRKDPGERTRKVTVQLLKRTHGGKVTSAYKIMEELIDTVAEHDHLKTYGAKVAIAWMFDKKPDADGKLVLGTAKKVNDLDRDLHGYDFLILLNHEAWNKQLSDAQMQALMDHELCHLSISYDGQGVPKKDSNGRYCWRLRKHDIEEFEGPARRHGIWKQDISSFVEAAQESSSRPLLKIAESDENKGAAKAATG